MKIPIVNEKDKIIEYKERENLDINSIYRVSALWVKDKEDNILLAQRSFNKKNDPGLWGPAVAGTVEKGETYELNIIKEAEEEIGLTNFKMTLGPKVRRKIKHQYFVQWFVAIVDHNYKFIKQDIEVEEIKWFSKGELDKLLNETPEIFLPNIKEYIEIL